jgi:predicted HTH domain antitoxin
MGSMGAIVEIEDSLAELLQKTNQSLDKAAREMIVLELYRRGSISSGRAAELLGMRRMDFVHHASRLGIPCIDMTKDEWEAEKAALEAWPPS